MRKADVERILRGGGGSSSPLIERSRGQEVRRYSQIKSQTSIHPDLHTSGFTLAEVLITLGIIGVVAALTLPTLIANHRDKANVVQLKKFYSIISQAYQAITFDEGTPDTWGVPESNYAESNELLYNKFKPYLKVMIDCKDNLEKCITTEPYKFNNGLSMSYVFNDSDDTHNRYFVTLADGGVVGFALYPKIVTSGGTTSGNYGIIYYDLNGPKAPNQFGQDMFQFALAKNKIILPSDGVEESEWVENCLNQGYFCSSWVIQYENMDYRRCPDKIAAGKHSCKE